MTSGRPQDPEEESQTESSAAEPPAPMQEEQDKATRKRMLVGIVGTILVLVVVFWFIFAFIIDPQAVVDAILSLELWQLGVLAQWLIPIPIGYGLILYWQKRDNFNLLSADAAQYAGKTDPPAEDASP